MGRFAAPRFTVQLRRGPVNARTLGRYEELLRLHAIPTLDRRPLPRSSATEIDALYTQLEKLLSAQTVHHVHTVLGACLGGPVRKGSLLVSPASKAEAPVPGEGEAGQVLDQDQLTALLAGSRGSALYTIAAAAAFTGARRNEILALR